MADFTLNLMSDDLLIAEHSNVFTCDAWNALTSSNARSRGLGEVTAESRLKHVHTIAGKQNKFNCATLNMQIHSFVSVITTCVQRKLLRINSSSTRRSKKWIKTLADL